MNAASLMVPRRLGRTGIEVRPLGLGGAGFLMNQHTKITDRSATRILREARRLGVDYIDTAPLYGDGLSESRIGTALAADPDVVIATKVGLSAPQGELTRPLSWEAVTASVESSLARLRRSSVDIVQIHELSADAWRPAMSPRGALAALGALKSRGLIRFIGVTGSEAPVLEKAVRTGEFDVVHLWRRWTLLDQSGESVLDAATVHDVGVVIGGPFASGMLARPKDPRSQLHYVSPSEAEREEALELERRLMRAGVSLASVALQFCLDPRVSVVVAGVRNTAQLRANIASAQDHEAAAFVGSHLRRHVATPAQADPLQQVG